MPTKTTEDSLTVVRDGGDETTTPSTRAEPTVPKSRLAARASNKSLARVQNCTMNRLATTSAHT